QWMIDGCLEWQRNGLKPPPAVREATAEYLEAEDAIATWMGDCCTRDPDAWENSTVLFQSWCAWAKVAGEPIGSQRAFSQKLQDRLQPRRTEDGRGFRGVKIKNRDDAEADEVRPHGGMKVKMVTYYEKRSRMTLLTLSQIIDVSRAHVYV